MNKNTIEYSLYGKAIEGLNAQQIALALSTQGLTDIQSEQKVICEEISLLTNLDEQKNEYAISSGRIATILALIPIIFIFILYLKYGYSFFSCFLKEIVLMTDFLQNAILFIIPFLCTFIYYIIIGIIYGSLLSPKELFERIKSKLLNMRLKKYARKNNINYKYLSQNFKFEISKKKSDLNNAERNTIMIQKHITDLEDKINLLDVN